MKTLYYFTWLIMPFFACFSQSKRDLITGLKTRTNAGRPNWDKVFKQMSEQRKGKV